jgi:hypothetical protein
MNSVEASVGHFAIDSGVAADKDTPKCRWEFHSGLQQAPVAVATCETLSGLERSDKTKGKEEMDIRNEHTQGSRRSRAPSPLQQAPRRRDHERNTTAVWSAATKLKSKEEKDIRNEHAHGGAAQPEVLKSRVRGLHDLRIVGEHQDVNKYRDQNDPCEYLRPVKYLHRVHAKEIDEHREKNRGRNHDVEQPGFPGFNGKT